VIIGSLDAGVSYSTPLYCAIGVASIMLAPTDATICVPNLSMKLSVIIPVYNEAQTTTEVIDRVWAVDLGAIEKEVIIADDGSTDATAAIIDAHRYIRDGLIQLHHNPISPR
jgi:hypothetical protein